MTFASNQLHSSHTRFIQHFLELHGFSEPPLPHFLFYFEYYIKISVNMFAKALTLFAIFATAYSGVVPAAPIAYAAPLATTYVSDGPHLGQQAEHTVRGFGGLSTVSQYSKAVDSPFTSVRKTDTRVTNDALHTYASPIAHTYAAAPIAHSYAAAPVAHHYAAAPIAHSYAAAPAVASYAAAPAPVYAQAPVAAYHHAAPAPIVKSYHAAPAQVATYASAPVAYSSPVAYSAPVAKVHAAPVATYAAAPVAKVHQPLLGVAYSAVSPAVATLNFNGYGIQYGY